MKVSKDNNSEHSDKDIVIKKPNRMMTCGHNDDDNVAAKVNAQKLCGCPESKPGIINTDPMAHLPDCLIRKKLQTGRFTVNTSVTPSKIKDGYSLGVVLGEENY